MGMSLLLVVGCSSMSINHDFDPAIDFTKYGSYAWGDGPASASDQTDHVIRSAVDSEMAAKGIFKSTGGQPDLLIAYYGSLQDRYDVTTRGYAYWRGYPVAKEASTSRFTVGSLVIDIVDARANQLVWQGWASDAADDAGRNEDLAREAVSKILADFPPR
jgi:hypothetical protein